MAEFVNLAIKLLNETDITQKQAITDKMKGMIDSMTLLSIIRIYSNKYITEKQFDYIEAWLIENGIFNDEIPNFVVAIAKSLVDEDIKIKFFKSLLSKDIFDSYQSVIIEVHSINDYDMFVTNIFLIFLATLEFFKDSTCLVNIKEHMSKNYSEELKMIIKDENKLAILKNIWKDIDKFIF